MKQIDYWKAYNKTRSQVLERDGYRCRICNGNELLIVHHKIPRKQNGSDELDNLITFCSICHIAAEQQIIGRKTRRRLKHMNKTSEWFFEKCLILGINNINRW